MNIQKKTTEIANDLMDTFTWVLKKFESPPPVDLRQKALGSEAEVSVSIKAGGTGEVTAVVGGSRQHFPARALQGNQGFAKGEKVKIVDVASNVVYVERWEPTVDAEIVASSNEVQS